MDEIMLLVVLLTGEVLAQPSTPAECLAVRVAIERGDRVVADTEDGSEDVIAATCVTRRDVEAMGMAGPEASPGKGRTPVPRRSERRAGS